MLFNLKCLVLFAMIRQTAYNTLRTVEQLGYAVSAGTIKYDNLIGGHITVHSPKKHPDFLIHRINELLSNFEITQEKFENFRDSILTKISVKDLTMHEEASRAWHEVCNR